jgi:hypothetical protein
VRAALQAEQTQGVCIATSASARNQLIGIGGAIDGVSWTDSEGERPKYDKTIGTSAQVNAYTAVLASVEEGVGTIAHAVYMGELSPSLQGQTIHMFTNNRSALATLRAPTRRSGQAIVSKILKHAKSLKASGNSLIFAWAPVNPIFRLGQRAKLSVQQSTNRERQVQGRARFTRKTVRIVQERLVRASLQAPTMFGESVCRIDTAWPGDHTRRVYDSLSKRQASALVQLRTGMTPLNGYLHFMGASETSLCDCGEAAESRQHFIFFCPKWVEQHKILAGWTNGNELSRLLGGKSATDTDNWKPDMDAV